MPIKVCGLTRAEDVQACLQLEVDFLGFIFHAPSPRHLEPEQAQSLPRGQALRVGVFVRQSPEQVLQIMHQARLDLAQLHGDYSQQDCARIGPGKIIKTLWPERFPGPEELQREMESFSDYCSYFLLDPGKSGGGHGRGLQLPWPRLPKPAKPWFLAGGLSPASLPRALQDFRPWAVDLNSGVESSPGCKDRAKLLKCLRIWQSSQSIQGDQNA